MFFTIVLSTFVFLIGFLLWNKPNKNGGNKLPGPLPLPLLGNLLQMRFRPHVAFSKWAKRYGPIYRIKMGLKDAVIVNDHKLIKELFNEPASTGRLSERCNWEENRPAIFDALDEFTEATMVVSTNGLLFAPVLRCIAPNLMGWNRYRNCVNKVMSLFQDTISKHKETFNSTELRDYIDHHLLEIANETDPNSSFYKDAGDANLIAGVFDLFFAGAESSMPYSEAVISEILRITSIAPIGNLHEMRSDLIFHGYHIPKGATVFANLYGMHHDPVIWGDLEIFRPERFLNEDGTKFVQNEALISFAEGKRKCIGETFAMDALFVFVTSIFQKFDILPDPEKRAEFEAQFGILLEPKPFKVMVSSRKF